MLVHAPPGLSAYLCKLCPMCQFVQARGDIHPTTTRNLRIISVWSAQPTGSVGNLACCKISRLGCACMPNSGGGHESIKYAKKP